MSSDGDAITIDRVTKTYRINVGRARVREMLPWPLDAGIRRAFPRWWLKNTFNALDDISLVVPKGSTLGVVGHNGAGKTTLLKVIAGVTAPTAGSVRVPGRVAALIDALVGFNPDLTGRENVFLLGSMHGFPRKTMSSQMARIMDFAEVDESADTPVKRYSAGMAARLGFATLIALDVDILLIDEVLAVGDASFQRKCVEWLDEFRAAGGTLVFVSHNLSLVRSMTEHLIWIDRGRTVKAGPTSSVLSEYVKSMEHREGGDQAFGKRQARKAAVARGLHRWGAGGARVDAVHVEDIAEDGSGVEFAIDYEADGIDSAHFCVGFVDEAERDIGASISPIVRLVGSDGGIRCRIRPLPLRSGIYFPVIAIMTPDGLVRDRWRLDRAVVVDRERDEVSEIFGPVEIEASWDDVGPR
jgi:ABC-type polysaccharide/polyol phosphate transport system ATPase subunit